MTTLHSVMSALAKQVKDPTASVEDQAYLLLLFAQLPEYNEEARFLFDQLAADRRRRVQTDDIYSVCLRLLALARYDAQSVEGGILAILAQRLIKREQAVGGPYMAGAYSALQTNAVIAQLMRQLGGPLAKVEAFLRNEVASRPEVLLDVEQSWLLVWPEKLVDAPESIRLQTTPADSLARLVAKLCLLLRPVLVESDEHVVLSPYAQGAEAISDAVRRTIDTRTPPPLRESLEETEAMVTTADASYEIRLLSTFFEESLAEQSDLISTDHLATKLNVANHYTWMAYTRYDDFIDEEAEPRFLPAANLAHRRALKAYIAACQQDEAAQQLVETTFDQMDAANAWELAYCRYTVKGETITIGELPDYGDFTLLAERAGAHTLGPRILAHLQSPLDERGYERLTTALHHYLIARQLNDDVHDWVKDARAGHISPIVAWLLKKTHTTPGSYPIDELVVQLQSVFWQSGLEEMSRVILRHTDLALTSLADSQLLQANSSFEQRTILPIIHSAQRALERYQEQKRFLASYKAADVFMSKRPV